MQNFLLALLRHVLLLHILLFLSDAGLTFLLLVLLESFLALRQLFQQLALLLQLDSILFLLVFRAFINDTLNVTAKFLTHAYLVHTSVFFMLVDLRFDCFQCTQGVNPTILLLGHESIVEVLTLGGLG